MVAALGVGLGVVFRGNPAGSLRDAGTTLLAIMYLGFLGSFGVQICCGRDFPELSGVWVLLITVLGNQGLRHRSIFRRFDAWTTQTVSVDQPGQVDRRCDWRSAGQCGCRGPAGCRRHGDDHRSRGGKRRGRTEWGSVRRSVCSSYLMLLFRSLGRPSLESACRFRDNLATC